MTNRNKMYDSNSKVRKLLLCSGFKDLHFFPHTRFSKDVHFQDLSFDGCCSLGKQFVLFQVKTNQRPTKYIQSRLLEVSKESGLLLFWFNVIKKEVEVYPKDL